MAGQVLPEAILFDLDDTIVSSGSLTEKLWRELCDKHAPRIHGADKQLLLENIYKAGNWYWSDDERHRTGRLDLVKARREVVALAFSYLGIHETDIAYEIADSYTITKEKKTALFPDAIKTLQYFRNQGLKTALLTNGSSEFQRNKIERFRLAQYFDYILVEGEFGAGKPDRAVFEHVLNRLDTIPENAWMIGDDLNRDIGGAQAVGIFSVWVDWKNEGLPETASIYPDRTVVAISELVE